MNLIKGMEAELYHATLRGSFEEMSSMFDWVNKITPSGNNVLHVHVGRPLNNTIKKSKVINVEFIQAVLNCDSSLLRKENSNGDTPLHLSARFGHKEAVEAFLQQESQTRSSALIRMINKRKDSALHEAAQAGHVDVVRVLVKADPDFRYEPNVAGEIPIYLAAERGSTESVVTILESCNDLSALTFRGPCGRTALHAAIYWGKAEMVEKMLEKDSSVVRVQDNEGLTPFHCAAEDISKCQLLKLLLKYDNKKKESSAVYIQDNEGRTALHIAMIQCNWKAITKLIASCPDCIEIVDNNGQNVVHYAAKWGCLLKIKTFMSLGRFDYLANNKDVDGNTPLHLLAASILNTCGHLCLNLLPDFIRDNPFIDLKAYNNQNLTFGDIVASDDRILQREFILQRVKDSLALRGRRIKKYDVENAIVGNDLGEANILTLKKASEIRLVVAALITTVSFTAGFTLPGGFDQNPGNNMGMAVLKRKATFKAFLISDAIAFACSTVAVLIYFMLAIANSRWHIKARSIAADFFTTISLGALMIAFTTGGSAVVSHSPSLVIAIWAISMIFFICYVPLVHRSFRDFRLLTRRCSDTIHRIY